MNIKKIDVFDLKFDGDILVVKSILDNEYESNNNLRFAWYIFFGSDVVKKINYQRMPFSYFKAEKIGKYKIKAFVKDIASNNKCELVYYYDVNKSTSPILYEKSMSEKPVIVPHITQINQDYYKFDVQNFAQKDCLFSWYLYQDNDDNVINKTQYSSIVDVIFKLEKGKKYKAKLFIKNKGYKESISTEWFTTAL